MFYKCNGLFTEYVICDINKSVQTYNATSFKIDTYPINGSWDFLVHLEELETMPEFQGTMA